MLISLLILSGIILLALGGEAMIRGSLAAAHKLGVSPLVCGLVIVGFGTSAPELVVSVNATISAQPDIALGNIIGSNIGNILLILGVCALITPLAVKPELLRRDAISVLVATLLFILLVIDGELGLWDGVLLALVLLAYIVYVYHKESRLLSGSDSLLQAEDSEIATLPKSGWLIAAMIATGLALLLVGSQLLLQGALRLASLFDASSSAIGLTLVAVGTSIPEISVSVIATLRRHADVAIGNVLGSNLFNVLGILGLSSIMAPLPITGRIQEFDQWVMLAAIVFILPLMYTARRISRIEGSVLLACYGLYVWAGFWFFN